MAGETRERAAALVVRAWLEPGREQGDALRARITYSTDLLRSERTELVAASAEEIASAVCAWLQRFLAG